MLSDPDISRGTGPFAYLIISWQIHFVAHEYILLSVRRAELTELAMQYVSSFSPLPVRRHHRARSTVWMLRHAGGLFQPV